MSHLDAAVVGAASNEVGGTPEIGRKELGAQKSGGGGEGGSVFNHGVDPQLRIIVNLGSMIQAASTENLRLPVGEDGREICLCFRSKGDCNRSFTRSHVPLRGHTQ